MYKENIMIDHQHKFINACFSEVGRVFCDSTVAGLNPTGVKGIFSSAFELSAQAEIM